MNDLAFELNKSLLRRIVASRYEYPLSFSIDELAEELHVTTNQDIGEIKGYIKALFEVLNVLGANVYHEGNVKLEDLDAAAVGAIALSIHEGVTGPFIFRNPQDASEMLSGSWLLHQIEQCRERGMQFNHEASRIRDVVCVFVLASLEGEPALLFQYDDRPKVNDWKIIGGRIDWRDFPSRKRLDTLSESGALENTWEEDLKVAAYEAAKREFSEEVKPPKETLSEFNIVPITDKVIEHKELSPVIGAYTHYRVHPFKCVNLVLPESCLQEEFLGEKQRRTKWIKLSDILLPRPKFKMWPPALREHMQSGQWFSTDWLSTPQVIEKKGASLSEVVNPEIELFGVRINVKNLLEVFKSRLRPRK